MNKNNKELKLSNAINAVKKKIRLEENLYLKYVFLLGVYGVVFIVVGTVIAFLAQMLSISAIIKSLLIVGGATGIMYSIPYAINQLKRNKSKKVISEIANEIVIDGKKIDKRNLEKAVIIKNDKAVENKEDELRNLHNKSAFIILKEKGLGTIVFKETLLRNLALDNNGCSIVKTDYELKAVTADGKEKIIESEIGTESLLKSRKKVRN